MIRRTAFGAACVLVAFFAACGGDDSGPGLATAPAQTSLATPGAAPSATPTPSPVASTAKKLGTSAGGATTVKAPDFAALAGAKASFGVLDRAGWEIEMPDSWNGELVLYAHGFAGFGTEVAVQTPPAALRKYFVTNGFAWAASSFSENGYDPGIGADDTLALKSLFEQKYGPAKKTYLVGASMGGNVVSLALENQADDYDGALSICGALTGIEQIDYLVSWVAVAEFTSGLHFPIGEAGGNAARVFLSDMPRELGPVASPTPKGQQFASIVKNLTGGPRPFFQEGFAEQYSVNFGLALLDPERKFLVNRAATNTNAKYHIDSGLGLTDDQVNSGVRRFASDPAARNAEAHPDAVPTTGKISDPLLTLHGTGDLFVPISIERDYKAKVQAAGKSDLLVQRAIRSGGHCKFSDGELTTAFADLVNWVKNGTKPKGEDLSGDLTNAGKEFTNPIRPGDPGGMN